MHYWRAWVIFFTFWRFGVWSMLTPLIKSKVLRGGYALLQGRRHDPETAGARLRAALEALGPIFVKLGQVISTRQDILPLAMAKELAKLQDQVPPFSNEIAKKRMEQSWGQAIDDIFLHLDQEPIASASIAQVYLGKLKDGSEVAVKILRPAMLEVIKKDIALMRFMASCLLRFSYDIRRLKPHEVINELEGYLHDELDLLKEAANASELRRRMQGLPILIPQMYWDYCRSDVLVMQKMNGIPISQMQALRDQGVDLSKLAQEGLTLFFTQVFRDGFFHADMHPGNIMVSVEPETHGHYILLDFGITGTLSASDKEYLAQNFTAFFRRDYKKVAQLHIESAWVPRDTRVEQLEAAIRGVCEPYFDRPLKDISLGMVLMRLFQVSRRFHVEIQPQLTLLQKTLLNIEGLGRQLDPQLDLWKTAQPFLEQWMLDEVGFKKLWKNMQAESVHWIKHGPALPRLLAEYLQKNTAQQTSLPLTVKSPPLLKSKRVWIALALGVFLGWLIFGRLALL